jgi:hypothetical protein
MKLAAVLVLLTSSVAAASPRMNLRIGAYVVASATVSASMAASRRSVEIHTSAGRAPVAAVVVRGEVKLMSDAAAEIHAPQGGDLLVTVLY